MKKEELVKIQIRCPSSLYQLIKDKAIKNRRSINSEMILYLESAVKKAGKND